MFVCCCFFGSGKNWLLWQLFSFLCLNLANIQASVNRTIGSLVIIIISSSFIIIFYFGLILKKLSAVSFKNKNGFHNMPYVASES